MSAFKHLIDTFHSQLYFWEILSACARLQVLQQSWPTLKHSFCLHFSLLVKKWPKNWIILETMQIPKANDHYDYASLKFRWKRWGSYFVTSINMVILTFTPPVLHFLVLYFLLWETWKHCSCLKAHRHKSHTDACSRTP